MGAIFLAIPYIILIWYLIRRSLKWTQACHGICHRKPFKLSFITIFIFFAAMPLLGFVFPDSSVQRVFQIIGNFWLGILLYTILTVTTAYIVKFFLKLFKIFTPAQLAERKIFARLGGTLVIIITVVSICGYIHSKDIQANEYDVTIDKASNDITIVMAADFHMGYNTGLKELKKSVKIINSMNADVVCLPGDIFNNDYDALKDPEKMIAVLKTIKSKYGVYASYGNHDVQEPLFCGFTFSGVKHPVSDPRMDTFLKKSNITLLQDDSVLIGNSFYLVGRRDDDKPGRGAETRLSASALLNKLDNSMPIIVMDHSPADLDNLSSAGCDLDLSGHTHDGQVFPLNLINKLIWKNPAGKIKVGNMTSVVTSGVGVFGPDMRVGTDSEIVKINVTFSK